MTSVVEMLAASPALFVGTVFVLGLAVGSFLNVVIYRLPVMLDRQWRRQCAEITGESAAATLPAGLPERFDLVAPRSACPACRAPITALQNIPVLSWLVLRGRCARCRAPISARYPLVELLTGILSAVVAREYGFGWPALAALVLTWYLVALAFIDLDTQFLPDCLTLPLLWMGLAASLAVGPSHVQATPVDLRSGVIGAMAGYLSLWTVYHLFRLATGKEGMGYGDFKLLAALGAWLGWQMLLPVILVAAVTGAVVGIFLIVVRSHARSKPIPFGPFLAAAGWIMAVAGPRLVGGWLGLFTAAGR